MNKIGYPIKIMPPRQTVSVGFGCRQMVFMSEGETPSAQQNQLLKEALLTGSNALKKQSEPRSHPDRNGVDAPRHEEDLLKDPEDGNPHGWGLAKFNPNRENPNLANNRFTLQKSFAPAHTDANFDQAVQQHLQETPNTLMAHLMHKALPNRPLVNEEDLHPFSHSSAQGEHWAGMFNGDVNGGRTPPIVGPLESTYCPLLETQAKGTNSGEKLLLSFLGRLKQSLGHLTPTENDLTQTVKAFAQTLQSFLQASTPIYQPLDESIAGLTGQIQWSPSVNYIVSNGQMVMAFRKGRKLYLNQHPKLLGNQLQMENKLQAVSTQTTPQKLNTDFGYIISSEPFQPSEQALTNQNLEKLKWLELPQDHILTLFRKADGSISPTLTPLSLALQSN
jgi:predicted glutamine amidotransferase